MEDLLQHRRRRRGWWRTLGGLAAVVVALAGGAYWWSTSETESPEPRQSRRAMADARGAIDSSLEAARRPLEVGPEARDRRNESARTFDDAWTKGSPARMRGTLEEHHSVFAALRAHNLPSSKIQPVVDATGEVFDFSRSRPDDTWYVEVDSTGTITTFRYETSPVDVWETVRNSNGSYACSKIKVPVERRRATVSGTVERSLWTAFAESSAGNNAVLIDRFSDIFAYSVDFNRETRPGDRFTLVVEKVYLEGEFLRYGRILAAEYLQGRSDAHRGFYHEDDDGEGGGYYTAEGKSLKRQFVKSPLATTRVTSQYGQRHHPTLGEQRMHRGVDYGAPIGTPVRAVADGTVTYAGRKGANGNLVVLRHANGYVTLYAHLHDIHVDAGERISKKTIVGEVGNTGRSTGPHLHFGMKQNGRYVDPMEIEAKRADPLDSDERTHFKKQVVEPLLEELKSARPSRSAEASREDKSEEG
jgi:murein DD-endopeptidase MepM/ murein hydrolase activator NlpD